MLKSVFLVGLGAMVVVYACVSTQSQPVSDTSEFEISAALAEVPAVRPSTPAGSHFFPVGFMGPADEAEFPRIAAAGFNIVYEFRSIQEIEEAEAYLTQAEAAGLKVIQNMPACRAYESHDPVCDEWEADVWNEAAWSEFISTMATHDNLVAWFLPDEITNYAAAADLYRWVKKYDPLQRPVYGNPGTFEFEKIARFPAFSDFLWVACYPEYYQEPRAIVTYGMRLAARAVQNSSDNWGAILQFFDSTDFGEGTGHPTARELRADSYQAIIGGATGLWYFNYEMGQDLDGLMAELERIANELGGAGGLNQVILSPPVPQTIVKRVVSGPTQSPPAGGEAYDSIQILQKEYRGTHLITVNIASDSVLVEFSNLPPETVAIEALFEGRTIPVCDGSFQDKFAQDEVHIYRLITNS